MHLNIFWCLSSTTECLGVRSILVIDKKKQAMAQRVKNAPTISLSLASHVPLEAFYVCSFVTFLARLGCMHGRYLLEMGFKNLWTLLDPGCFYSLCLSMPDAWEILITSSYWRLGDIPSKGPKTLGLYISFAEKSDYSLTLPACISTAGK